MTATPFPRDTAGTALNAAITARTAQVATLAAGPAKDFASAELDRDQQALVVVLMANGRLSAAKILSTMT